jgi:hypothetical protein
MTHHIDIQYDMHTRCHLQIYRCSFLARRTLRLARLELLDLALPVVLWVEAKHFPRLLDTDETFTRVTRVRLVRDIGEDALDEFGGWGGERGVGISDVEDVGALEGLFEREAETLCAVARVDIAEAATGVSMATTWMTRMTRMTRMARMASMARLLVAKLESKWL